MAMQLPSSSSLSNDFIYDVFISFRGTDTRFGFTGNLYKALSDKGIHTFIDDKELKRGDEITPSLLKGIEDSRTAIIIFSKDYASSSFCLDELVHIIHYFKENSRLVLPVFYGTEPTEVRKLKDSYGEALAKHEERFQNNKENMERLLKWKKALNQAANLSGHHFNQGNEYERDFIEKIVTDVSNKINHVPLHVADYLVGLKSRISEVNLLLDLGSTDGVFIIGILGTGGMGKTTLAQAVYNLIANQFECKCFLHNVRENSVKHGLVYLQEQLLSKSIGLKTQFGHVNEGIPIIKRRLSQKKVLLILDDVDKREQLNNLVGEPGWLGHGSRVIITTRDKQLLSGHQIERIYEANGLNKQEALELLRKVAFKSNKNDSRYDSILNRAVKYASGLPLALDVVGSNLFGKSIAECESLLDKYERIPHEDIQKILKVSYDALDEEQQSVFLDIACVFKGHGEEYVQKVLHDHYGYCIKSHIGVLVDKSLIKINGEYAGGVTLQDFRFFEEAKLTLHDLIEDMGIEIVRQESIKEPGERSRLWCRDDIVHVLQENTGTSKIEMIYLNSPSMKLVDMNEKAFKTMTNLKTLIIQGGNFSKGPKYLPSSLRVMNSNEFSSESLSYCFSNKNFENMKHLILDWSQSLIHIPNMSGLPNLQKLSFEYCRHLITIDNSIGELNKLEILSANYCSELESFPPLQLRLKKLEIIKANGCLKLKFFPPLLLPSLKKLELSYCKSLKSFPELLCKMTNIKKIKLCDTSLGELPFSLPLSFHYLSELEWLQVNRVRMLRFPKYNDRMNPIVFSKMDTVALVETNLSDECLPILLKWFVNVTYLYLSKNNFKILPECLSECHHLKHLYLEYCKSLEEIRGIPPNLREFSAVGCESLSLESKRRLLSQDLHDAGCTKISFPNGSERIPDWFEHQIRGDTVSFWFSKKIPTITCIFLLPGSASLPEFNLFLNDKEIEVTNTSLNFYDEDDELLPSQHAFSFDMNLYHHIKQSFACKPYEVYEAFKINEWNHVELKWKIYYLSDTQEDDHVADTEEDDSLTDKEEDDHVSDTEEDDLSDTEEGEKELKILSSGAQMGIHVSWYGYDWSDTKYDCFCAQIRKEKSNKVGEVIFTNPYSNISLSQFVPPLKKQRLVELGVSETKDDDDFSAQFLIGIHQEKRNMDEDATLMLHSGERKTKSDEDINALLQQRELMKVEERKTWGTFLGLGASNSNTDGDEIEILSSAQDERKMWGTFLGLGASNSNTDGDEIEILSSVQMAEEDDVLFTNPL